MRRRLASLVLSACVLASGTASADDATARAEQLFQEARALVDAGRYGEACPKLAESLRLDPAVGTQFNLADCYEHVGRTATAHALFGEVARIARAAGKFEREKSARERAAALEPKLARVRIVPASPAPGQETRIDGEAVKAAADPLAVDPGDHELTASAPGRNAWSTRFRVEPAATATVQIPVLVDPNPRRATDEPKSGQRTLAAIVGGVGVAGVAVGAVSGVMAMSTRSDADRLCPKDVTPLRCPTQEGADRWNEAKTFGDVSTVAFVVGGVALAGAAVLWLTAPKARTRAGVGLGGVAFEGSF